MTYIIAELSANPGSKYKFEKYIEAAATAGANAIKFQLYKPDDLPDYNPRVHYCVEPEYLGWLFNPAKNCGIDCFASVFAPWAVEALKKFKPPYYKIASPESSKLKDYPSVIKAIRKTGIPIIWSTGRDMTWMKDEEDDLIMYCKQGYPATIDETDLYFIRENDVGFSDHTAGIISTLAAIAAGAGVIEKHFKLDNHCVDAAFSIFPRELHALCDLCS